MASSEFTFRLSATGGDQLVRVLRGAGEAGERMAAQIQQSAQRSGTALTVVEQGAERAARALVRTQQAAAGGIGGPRFQQGLQAAGFQIGDFITQVQAGGNAFTAFAQQGGQLAGALAGGLAGLVVQIGAVAAQYLLSARSADDSRAADERLRAASEAVNAVLETREDRARRAAQATLDLATATARASEVSLSERRGTLLVEQTNIERAIGRTELDAAAASPRNRVAVEQDLVEQRRELARVQALLVLNERQLADAREQAAAIRAAGTSNLLPPSARATSAEGAGQSAAAAAAVRQVTEGMRQQTQAAEALARANRTADEVYEERIQTLNRLLPELVRLEGIERANEIAARESVAALEERNRSLERGTQQTARAVSELGFTFESAFENAVIRGERLSSVLKGVADDIARIILRATVTEPVGNALKSAIGGINFGSVFSGISSLLGGGGGGGNVLGVPFSAVLNAKGNAFDGGRMVPFASGGIVNSPTPFQFDGGRLGVMGEAGPEAIMPLARDGSGRLGVRGGGGSSTTVNVTNVIDARGADPASEARIRAALKESEKRTVAAVLDQMRRGGATRAVIRGA
jgi:hypothetical protein